MTDDQAPQHCEAVAVIIRGGPGYRRPGDPFRWICYIARNDLDSGYVLAAIGTPSRADFRRAREELRQLGFRRLQFTRVSGRHGEFRFRDDL